MRRKSFQPERLSSARGLICRSCTEQKRLKCVQPRNAICQRRLLPTLGSATSLSPPSNLLLAQDHTGLNEASLFLASTQLGSEARYALRRIAPASAPAL